MPDETRISGFRGFRDFSFGEASRINLLVGRNNSGKSSLLEALHFLYSEGNPFSLLQSLLRRQELPIQPGDQSTPISVQDLFNWEMGGKNPQFDIATPSVRLTAIARFMAGSDVPSVIDLTAIRELGERKSSAAFFPGGLLFRNEVGVEMVATVQPPPSTHPPIFLSANSMSTLELSRLWDEVLKLMREDLVVDILRTLDEDIDDIVFLSGAARASSGDKVLLGWKGNRVRRPISTQGEGIKRVLALAVCMVVCRGSALFVDEIDTGIHHSAMEEMWRAVIRAAQSLSVRVFASTHSLDCLRGLADLCRHDAEIAAQVSVHKVEPSLERTIVFAGEELSIAIDREIEVR